MKKRIAAGVAVLAVGVGSMGGVASGKISPASCENGGGQEPPGQQPACKNDTLKQNPALNPADHAPPGQQP